MNREMILSCSGVCKSFGTLPALTGISVNVYSGRVVGLYGSSGSGKTTFLKLAAGLLRPTSGELTVCGMQQGRRYRAEVSFMPDSEYLPPQMMIHELPMLFNDLYDGFDIEKAYEMLTDLGIDMNKQLGAMSRGMSEKLRLVLCLCRKARLYLLDEPLASSSPASRREILGRALELTDENAAVVIASQHIEPIIDDVMILQSGTVRCYDSKTAVLAQAEKPLDDYLGEVFSCF